jgi:DNA-binding NtrC family response regulator
MSALQEIISGPKACTTRVLIVESQSELGLIWQRHLERLGMQVSRASTQNEATQHLHDHEVDIILLDLVLEDGAALAVSDYAEFCQPEARVVFVTNTTFFSDGSIFAHARNARAFLPSDTPPDDLAAMIEYYGSEGPTL